MHIYFLIERDSHFKLHDGAKMLHHEVGEEYHPR